jgi:hypothetical protein
MSPTAVTVAAERICCMRNLGWDAASAGPVLPHSALRTSIYKQKRACPVSHTPPCVDFAPLAMSQGVLTFLFATTMSIPILLHFVLPQPQSCLVTIYFAFICGTHALSVYSISCDVHRNKVCLSILLPLRARVPLSRSEVFRSLHRVLRPPPVLPPSLRPSVRADAAPPSFSLRPSCSVRVSHGCDGCGGRGGCKYELADHDTIDVRLVHPHGGSSSSNGGESL